MINNFLGIDVSKEHFDVSLSFISKKGKREARKRKFKNDDIGFQGLLSFLQKHNVEEVKACMEFTGCYGEALAEFLYNAGHFVSVVNPACIRFYAKSKLTRQKMIRLMQRLLQIIVKNRNLPVGCHHLLKRKN